MKTLKNIITVSIFLAGLVITGYALAAGLNPILHNSNRGLIGNNLNILGSYLLVFIGLLTGAVLLATSQIIRFEIEKEIE